MKTSSLNQLTDVLNYLGCRNNYLPCRDCLQISVLKLLQGIRVMTWLSSSKGLFAWLSPYQHLLFAKPFLFIIVENVVLNFIQSAAWGVLPSLYKGKRDDPGRLPSSWDASNTSWWGYLADQDSAARKNKTILRASHGPSRSSCSWIVD